MAKGIFERTTGKGERRLYVVVYAIDRTTRERRQVWVLVHGGIKDAEKRQREIKTALDVNGGLWPLDEPAPEADGTLLRDYCTTWAESVDVRPHTRREYERLIASPTGLVAAIGHLRLEDVQRSDIRKWMGERATAGASSLTIRNAVAVVRASLEDAVEDGRLKENPAVISRRKGRKSSVPGKPRRKIEAPAPDVVDKLIAAAAGDFRLMLTLAAGCGLRRGEIFGLRWEDVAGDSRTLTVRRSNIGGQLMEPKTEAGVRTVPLFASVRTELLKHRLASPFSQPDDLVFADAAGRPLNPERCSDYMKKTIKEAGLPERALRFHDLRHFCISRLIEEGANILLISKLAGHASPDISLRIYSHMMPTGAADAADLYDPITKKEAVNA